MALKIKKNVMRGYRKTFGHKSPFRRVYGSRNAGQAIGVTYRTGYKVAMDLAKLRSEIKGIKSRQNVEKNYVDRDVVTSSVGQVNASSDGIFLADVTPVISQGDGQGNRHGNSLKLTGMSFPISFIGQQNCRSARKIVVSLFRVRDNNNNTSGNDLVNTYWDLNPLNSLRDTGAPRNYRHSKHDGVTLVRQKTYMLKSPHQNYASDLTEQSHFTAKFNVTLQDVFRYATNPDVTPDGLRYFLVFQCDSGNVSTTDSTLDVPIQTGNSGVSLRLSQRSWYVDN